MKFNRHQLLVSSLLGILFAFPQGQAQASSHRANKKKTVGELLSQASESSRGSGVSLSANKSGTALPSASLGFQQRNTSVDLDSVKPPRSSELMRSETGNQAQYLKILDQQINELYKLTQRFKNSDNRGELWLRLAELYVEKSTVIDSKKESDYDKRLRDFQAGKTKVKPKLDTAEAREYNKKAIQLYEWFQRDFPRDEKNSQALFFLGYNYFELGNVKKGAHYYEILTEKYPDSPFLGEAYFALGEYYFENEQWTKAYKEYAYIIKDKKTPLAYFCFVQRRLVFVPSGKKQAGFELSGIHHQNPAARKPGVNWPAAVW